MLMVSITCPSTIIDSTGSSDPNQEFLQWTMIDAHLLSCITVTHTPVIYTSVLQFHHCSEVLEKYVKNWISIATPFQDK
ncbi:hypothetical protein LOK49_Contig195G00001 [Camellia lanceoleosa]|nr:hypothetical protein LOK49_Contig195G00001 [Camellia lanceoleosa]